MNYELAKRLKNAGFPQKGHNERKSSATTYYAPTLSELIEACPKTYEIDDYFDGDFTLKHWLEGEDEWHAGYEHCDGWYEGGEGKGTTPEAAVAHLWLALNEKKV